jgi:D-tyrosyl-tRNA(Tyr) deacylase
MIALLQRVSEATVQVKHGGELQTAGQIGPGLVVLVGVEKGDTENEAERLLQRIISYRVFNDEQGKMNLDLEKVGGQLMLVSQFTLAADTNKGQRPSFSRAAAPEQGRALFEYLLGLARTRLGSCATGEFGAHMMVQLVNDGPVTLQLRVPPPN